MDELRVDLAAFQGPLDLLLYLVQQEEIDVFEVPIARVADRFLDACRRDVHRLDVDRAGEFLVMASQLMVLKSRALLPRDESLELDDIDPRLDLVRQLLEYREFKSISAELDARRHTQAQRVPVRITPPHVAPPPVADEELELDLFGLVAAFQRLLAETGEDAHVALAKERLPITHFVGQIFDRLTELRGRIRFRDLLHAERDRSYVIGAFLALLELMKLRRIRATQDGLGEIHIELVVPDANQEDGAIGSALPQDEAVAQALDRPVVAEDAGGPRIVLMGSPAFAVPSLQALCGAGMTPRLVVTPPPRRSGRGRRMQQVPLAVAANQLQVPLHRTADINGRVSMRELEAARPELVVTVGFGQKLSPAVLALPTHGCVNVHASLLPRHRGASPVAGALRAGDTEVGVTVFRMDSKMDHGPLLGYRGIRLQGDETRDEVRERLATVGATLLVELLPPYMRGALTPEAQDHALASYAPKLEKRDGVINWDRPAVAVFHHIRSVTSWPGAQTAWQPRVRHDPLPIVIVQAHVLAGHAPKDDERAPEAAASPEASPGTVIAVSKAGIDVACAAGAIRVERLRAAGGRVMSVAAFLNGRRVMQGDRFAPPRPATSARGKARS